MSNTYLKVRSAVPKVTEAYIKAVFATVLLSVTVLYAYQWLGRRLPFPEPYKTYAGWVFASAIGLAVLGAVTEV